MALTIIPVPQPLTFPLSGDTYRVSGLSNGFNNVTIPDTNTDPTRSRQGVYILQVKANNNATVAPNVVVANPPSVDSAQNVNFGLTVSNATSLHYVLVMVF